MRSGSVAVASILSKNRASCFGRLLLSWMETNGAEEFMWFSSDFTEVARQNSVMKIAVIIASRNNPQGLETVISTLSLLDSGAHSIGYYVAHDVDDNVTPQALQRLKTYGIDVQLFAGNRPLYLGQPYNDIAQKITDADVYCTCTDRFIPLTQHWDQAIALTMGKKDDCVFWWNSHVPGGQLTFPIVSAKWLRASGRIYAACFPFWFDDTWLAELNAFVHGLPHLMPPIYFANVRKHPTKRLRDLRFWMDVYIAKRPERMAHAADISRKLGIKQAPNMEKIFEHCRVRERFWDEHWQEWEKIFGDVSAPDATYLAAKAEADAFMKAAREAVTP